LSNRICITNHNKSIYYENKNYIPKFYLQVISAKFNDSADNAIIVEGILDKQGKNFINPKEFLNADFKINIVRDNDMLPTNHILDLWHSAICTEYQEDKMIFTLKLQSKSILYKKSLVNSYSKTCIAQFGDSKCKFDKTNITKKYQNLVDNIQKNKVILKNKIPINYSGGDITFLFSNKDRKKFMILNHFSNVLELEKNIFFDMSKIEYIILTEGCDKKFSTCSNRFKNSINFRGQPFVPNEEFIDLLELSNINSYLDSMLKK
jgi:uncharacterized phage protein (TIGR02218 family)